jgi:hypothetical protein
MDTNINMEIDRNMYALCLRNKKRSNSQPVVPNSLMTMTPSYNPIPSPTRVITSNLIVLNPMHTMTSPINIPDDINFSSSIVVGTFSSSHPLWFHRLST